MLFPLEISISSNLGLVSNHWFALNSAPALTILTPWHNQRQYCVSSAFNVVRCLRPIAGSRYLPVMISRLLLSLRKSVASQQSEQLPTSRNSQNMVFLGPRRSAGSEEDDIPLRAYHSAQGMDY